MQRAVTVLAWRKSAAIDVGFNLHGKGGLAGRAVDGGERSVLEVTVRGVVAGEVAESVAAADDGGWPCREGEAETRSYVVVLRWDACGLADAVHAGDLQCAGLGCTRVGDRPQEVIV